jgi:hypothetical protein
MLGIVWGGETFYGKEAKMKGRRNLVIQGIRTGAFIALLGSMIGCGKTEVPEMGNWEPKSETAVTENARDACQHETDVRMQLHGYPRRPKANTPQHAYRLTYFRECMAEKGFAPVD